MQDRPVLLCDVMDTLVYNPFNREIPEFFGLSTGELLRQKHPTAWLEFERGAIDEAEYLRRYFADGRGFEHRAFKNVVRAAYRFVDGAELLLSELRDQGVEMHALSNYPIWYRDIEHKLGLSRYLKWSFVSCRTGLRKPAAEAFQHALKTLNLSPRGCLFVDDSFVNCQAAEAVGIPAIHFVGVDTLRSRLFHRGIPRAN